MAGLKPPRPRLLVQALEERILYSADAAQLLGLPVDVRADAASAHSHLPMAMRQTVAVLPWREEQAQAERLELIFIDSQVPQAASLADQLMAQRPAGTRFDVVLLLPDEDGLAQITQVLTVERDVAAVHIISHGTQGAMQLGGTQWDITNLAAQTAYLQRWQEALAADGDLLLYGCDVAAGPQGEGFLRKLAQLTGADVAASNNPTGDAAQGADWRLEQRTGPIEAPALAAPQWAHTLALVPQGGETRVNASTTGVQNTTGYGGGNVAMDANGNYVVVFGDLNVDDGNVYAQRYNAAGVVQGAAILINTTLAANQFAPAVAMAPDGRFVVTWVSDLQDDPGDTGVYVRTFAANGSATSVETLLNSSVVGPQGETKVGMDDAGNFVVVFSDDNVNAGDIYAQRFNSAGVALGGNFQVNTFTADYQAFSDIAVHGPTGSFVVVWESNLQDGRGTGVFGQRYNAAGVAQGGEFQVNVNTLDAQESGKVAYAADGSFVVAWESGGAEMNYMLRRYSAAGVALSGEMLVNTTTADDQRWGDIAFSHGNQLIVTWGSFDQDGEDWGIYAQIVDAATGAMVGAEMQLSTSTTGAQQFPSLAVAGGKAVVVWEGNGTVADQQDAAGVFMQRLAIDGVSVSPTSGLVTTEAAGTAQFNVVLDTAPSANVTIPVSVSNAVEATVSTALLTFTPGNWNTPQAVTVTGLDDALDDGDRAFTVVLGAASSGDAHYNGFDAADVAATNLDNDNQSTVVVNTTSDVSDGDTSSLYALLGNPGADGFISLREAITAANNSPNGGGGADRVHFAIPTNAAGFDLLRGVAVVTTSSALPMVTSALIIDATTQTSNIGNTNAGTLGSGGTVGVDGLALAAVQRPEVELQDGGGFDTGLRFASGATGSELRGMAIYGFEYRDLLLEADNLVIEGNVIGSPAHSLTDTGFGTRTARTGIEIESAANGVLRNNLVAYTGQDAVRNLNTGASNWLIEGNEMVGAGIGEGFRDMLNVSGTGFVVRGNLFRDATSSGVDFLSNAAGTHFVNNTVTGLNGSEGHAVRVWLGASGVLLDRNIITGNPGGGVMLDSGNTVLTRNAIHGNGGTLELDLGSDGLTPNDAGDADSGVNTLQNHPVLTSASTDGAGTITVIGSLNSIPNTHYVVELFATTAEDASGYGGAQRYLGSIPTTTTGTGDVIFGTIRSGVLQAGEFVTATATRSDASFTVLLATSEFGPNLQVTSTGQSTVVVTTAADVADGDTSSLPALQADPGADGFISLREAITAANNTANGTGGADRIHFNIAGTGVHTVTLLSALPVISDAVILDASTDDSFAANSSRPAIVLNGNDVAGDGLTLSSSAGGSTIRGLVIRNFGDDAISISAGSDGNTIAGNYIGRLDATGAAAAATEVNGGNGLDVRGANNVVGGTAVADRNIIAGNGLGILLIDASATGNTVIGNYIGTDATGTVAIGNLSDGMRLTGGAANNTVGGSTPQARNLISGNLDDGVDLDGVGTTGNFIRGNYIGTDVSGTLALGNTNNGIDLGGSANGLAIGGTGAGDGNVIAFNADDGIMLINPSNTGIAILGNSIFGNGSLGIDLDNDGVTANDAGDADTGANGRQNFPVLITARTNASNQLILTGTLNSTANSYFRIEFFSNTSQNSSGYGDGQAYLGFANVATDGSGNASISATLTANVSVGSFISTTSTKATDNSYASFTDTSEFARNIAAVDSAQATVVVTTASDTSDGDITSISTLLANRGADGFISLREAITAANNTANGTGGADRIHFNIAGAPIGGAHTIAVGAGGLPDITDAVIIDGSTEPDFAGTPIIESNGSFAGAGADGLTLTTTADNSTVRGLVINRFGVHGLRVDADGTTVVGNYIGTDVSGTADLGNFLDGIVVSGDNNLIGGLTAADRNVVSGNNDDGIQIEGAASGTVVRGNYVGSDATGLVGLGNGNDGVIIFGSGNMIGGTALGASNLVLGNGDDAIEVNGGSAINNSLLGNRVDAHPGLGIDLFGGGANAGVDANDALDADTGANTMQNFPVLLTAGSLGGDTVITGNFNSQASSNYRIEFFANTSQDVSGHGEGQTYLGFANVATDGSGNATISTTLTANVAVGNFISATATKSDASYTSFTDTSEFARNIVVVSSSQATITVDTTSDVSDGDTTSLSTLLANKGADGFVSLREAITAANNTTNGSSADLINFGIAGSGTQIITLGSALPTLSEALVIDGTTQTGWVQGSFLPVVLDGNNLSINGLDFSATADNSTVRGLVLRDFNTAAINIASGASGIAVAGNWIGAFNSDGSDAGVTDINARGVRVFGNANTIGGSSAAARNVIGDHGFWGAVVLEGASASGNTVAGNYLGTTVSGNATRASLSFNGLGVLIQNGASNNTIGVPLASSRNIIGGLDTGITLDGNTTDGNVIQNNWIGLGADGSTALPITTTGMLLTDGDNTAVGGIGQGNTVVNAAYWGIRLMGSMSGTLVQGNYVGTDAAGTLNAPNADAGILVQTSALGSTMIGGTFVGQGNVVRHNGTDGIDVENATSVNVAILGNSLSGNAALGIDLGATGVTVNDNGDADTGSNNLQNFPLLTTARTNASNQLTLTGTLNSNANRFYRIEFFANNAQDGTGYGAGRTYLGFANVATDGSGNAVISTTLTADVPEGAFICATATQSDASYTTFTDTSEFARTVVAVSSTQATIVVDTASDVSDGDATSLSTLLANKGADGFISLREAIVAANNTANGSSADLINFDIAGTDVHTINPLTALPALTEAVVLDASTDDSFAANGNRPAIVLDGNNTFNGDGLVLSSTADGSTVRGFVIGDFTGSGIEIQAGSDGNIVVGNYIGRLLASGLIAGIGEGNTVSGVFVHGANNIIGGSNAADRNVIGGNSNGVSLSGSAATGNLVIGNYIGTDATGAVALGNSADGVVVSSGATSNIIGGTTAGERNVISGNGDDGVDLQNSTTSGNIVRGNYIGTDVSGNVDLGNVVEGVSISNGASNNVVGGTSAGAGNVISGNQNGVVIFNTATFNSVVGNVIGLNAAGSAALGNSVDGVWIFSAATNNTVGGLSAAERNIISANGDDGVDIGNTGTTGNGVGGNYIGTDVSGTVLLGNTNSGVEIGNSASSNLIGGTVAGAGNLIAGNGRGVSVISGAVLNSVLGNRIVGNLALGIDLGNNGVTANDAGDADIGNNNLQNFPVLTGAVSSGGNTTIAGGLNSLANSEYRIEFFSSPTGDATGSGEGQTYLGFATVTTDGSGNATLNATLTGVSVTLGHAVSATATQDLGIGGYGDTSEFAANVLASASRAISGTVWEDINSNGWVLDDGVGLANAVVSLYLDNGNAVPDAGDTLVNALLADAGGHYTFSGLADGSYYVVVDSRSFTSNSGLLGGFAMQDQWAEQTYGPAGSVTFDGSSYAYTASAGALFGGLRQDRGDNGASLMTAEHVTRAVLAGADVGNVDYGFSFSVITNTRDGDEVGANNRTIQGSLRQFVQNSNALVGTQTSEFRVPGNDPGFASGVAVFTLGASLPAASDTLVLDGRTQTTWGRNTNAVMLGSGGTVGANALALAQVAGPEVEIRAPAATISLIDLQGANSELRGLALLGGGTALNPGTATVRVFGNNTVVEGNVFGSHATAVADPGAPNRVQAVGMRLLAQGTVQNNLFAYIPMHGVSVEAGASNSLLNGNEFFRPALTQNTQAGIAVRDVTNVSITGNLIDESGANAVELYTNAVNGVLADNTFSNSGTLPGGEDAAVDILTGSTGNTLRGNLITGSTGSAIYINNAAGNVIGVVGDGNVLTAGGGNGIWVRDSAGTVIQANAIGTNRAGNLSAGFVGHGIQLEDAQSTVIGGVAAGQGNAVAFNQGAGVAGVSLSAMAVASNAVLGNGIRENQGMGVDLGADGVTANDVGDADTGPNNLQNFPVLASANSSVGDTTLIGSLNSNATSTYRIEFFSIAVADGSGHGQGQVYLGFTTVTTDGSGNARFAAVLRGVSVTAGHAVSAMATLDLGGGNYGSSSEFAANIVATNVATGINVGAISGTTTEAGGTASFSVALNTAPTADVTLGIGSSNLAEGSVSPVTLTFTPFNWNIAQTVLVTGVDDLIDDGDVGYSILTVAASSADALYNGLDAVDVAVVNRDDDAAGFVVSALSNATNEAGATATFTVALASQPTANVSLVWSSATPLEATVVGGVLSFTPANWNLPQPITVIGMADAAVDGDQPFTLLASASSADARYSGLGVPNVSGLNLDNTAPWFTSMGGAAVADVALPENTQAVTVLAADDADRPLQTLSFSLAGGADVARFSLHAITGALSFLVAPDFENPLDADADNVYEVQVRVSDGDRVPCKT